MVSGVGMAATVLWDNPRHDRTPRLPVVLLAIVSVPSGCSLRASLFVPRVVPVPARRTRPSCRSRAPPGAAPGRPGCAAAAGGYLRDRWTLGVLRFHPMPRYLPQYGQCAGTECSRSGRPARAQRPRVLLVSRRSRARHSRDPESLRAVLRSGVAARHRHGGWWPPPPRAVSVRYARVARADGGYTSGSRRGLFLRSRGRALPPTPRHRSIRPCWPATSASSCSTTRRRHDGRRSNGNLRRRCLFRAAAAVAARAPCCRAHACRWRAAAIHLRQLILKSSLNAYPQLEMRDALRLIPTPTTRFNAFFHARAAPGAATDWWRPRRAGVAASTGTVSQLGAPEAQLLQAKGMHDSCRRVAGRRDARRATARQFYASCLPRDPTLPPHSTCPSDGVLRVTPLRARKLFSVNASTRAAVPHCCTQRAPGLRIRHALARSAWCWSGALSSAASRPCMRARSTAGHPRRQRGAHARRRRRPRIPARRGTRPLQHGSTVILVTVRTLRFAPRVEPGRTGAWASAWRSSTR